MRHRFGGTLDAFVIGEDSTSVSGASLAVLRANVPITFWSAKTGGVQYTALLNLTGATVTYVTSDAGGQVPEFDGPDGTGPAEVRQMWADGSGAGTGPRTLIQARVSAALAAADGVVRSINAAPPTTAGDVVLDAGKVGAAPAGHGHQDTLDAVTSVQAEVDTLPHPSAANLTITDRVMGLYAGTTAISSGDGNLAALLAAAPSWARRVRLPKGAKSAPAGRYGAASAPAEYPIPDGAFFVSPGGDNAGDGSVASPWRTVGKAVANVPTGSTIVLRAGTYNQYATWYGKKLTLQPYPGERVVFDGAVPVTGWVDDSATRWHVNGWTTKFKQGGRPDLIGTKNDYAAHPDMVFVDGAPLRQVGFLADVVTGTFFADYANSRIYIGTDPAGRTVEASNLSRALYANLANGSTVRGLTFQRYATHPDLIAAVLATGDNLTFDNNVFEHNAAIGCSLIGNNGKFIDNTAAYNGQMGLHSHKSDNLLIQGNWMHHNNTELFWLGGAEGGLKVTTGSNQVWADNVCEDNYGDGLWADIDCVDIHIVRNVVRRNTHRGIKVEISARCIVASNLVMDNSTWGIYNNESNYVDIWNNTLIGNGRAIQATDWTRQKAHPLFTWNVGNTTIRNNLMVDGGGAHLGVEDLTRTRSAEDMTVTADYNGYWRTVAGTPQYAARWANVGGTSLFTWLYEFRAGTGQEANGVAVNDVPAPFTDPAAGDYTVLPGSAAAGAGVALPPEIAAAVGVPAGGGPVDLGILAPLPA